MNRLKAKRFVTYGLLLVTLIVFLLILDMDEMSWLRLKLGIDRVASAPHLLGETQFQDTVPLLVLFTTFKEASSHHAVAHRATIYNWASFDKANVKPVLFTDGPLATPAGTGKVRRKSQNLSLVEEALMNGWHVLPIQSTNSYGTPHLKSMYERVFEKYNATFYGYANGDILFDNSLVRNLQSIKHLMGDRLKGNVLLVGKRTDVTLNSHSSDRSPTQLGHKTYDRFSDSFSTPSLSIAQFLNKSSLKTTATKSGRMREPYAIDYFIFTKEQNTFDWNKTPNIVVGRIAYDQYLVAEAIQSRVNTIDLSRTTLCLHLSKPGVLDTGLLNEDRDYNLELLGKDYPYHRGLTSRTTYYMCCEGDKQPFLVERAAIFKSLGLLLGVG